MDVEKGQPSVEYDHPNAPIATRNLDPGIHTQTMSQRVVIIEEEEVEREISYGEKTCCDKAWHCDIGYWIKISGKGYAWWPFLILLYILLIAMSAAYIFLATAFCIFRCVLIDDANSIEHAENTASCVGCISLFTVAMIYSMGMDDCCKGHLDY